MERLTDQNYWEKYYSKSETTKKSIAGIVSVYDNYWDILISENQNKNQKTIIELGGYPGRYLAYLSDKFNLIPTCLDFNSDTVKVKESMDAFEIKDYKIIQADILNFNPTEKYDLVISNGFIEHFDDYEKVLKNHTNYLKEGGTMLIMIPNKRGLRRYYGYLVDYKNLKAHNLKCMKKDTFEKFANKNNLKLLKNEYFGAFPYSVHQKLNLPQKVIYGISRLFFKKVNPYLEKNPSKYYSSAIVAIFKKEI
jgi:trans-aconitate methyltransferase